jgi:hypothetical protein
MKLIHINPLYFSITCLLFLQIPILIAGDNNANKVAFQNVTTPVTKSLDAELLETADSIYNVMDLASTGLDNEAFQLAYKGYTKLLQEGVVAKTDLLTIADFSKASSEKRLFVLDVAHEKILYNTLVAHGRNSGLKYATDFSNKPESNKSSLGFYLTLDTYYGGNGYSLKLQGLEKGINDKAYKRAIVIHGSNYANPSYASSNGFLGRSFGCPALPSKQAAPIINTIKNGSVLFIYHPTNKYVAASSLLNS